MSASRIELIHVDRPYKIRIDYRDIGRCTFSECSRIQFEDARGGVRRRPKKRAEEAGCAREKKRFGPDAGKTSMPPK